jgi:hypothetical protein
MKWGALAVALAVLAFTAGAVLVTMQKSKTSAAQVLPSSGAAQMIPSSSTPALDPVKRAFVAKPKPSRAKCQNSSAEGNGPGDKTGDDRSSSSCDRQAGDAKNSGGNENEPDENDSGN